MPQININEIDQSLYTRVTNNNLLKCFVPGIATFGPVYEGETGSVPSFTNKEAFRKVFGYNLPEQNPIKNDYSKLYAEQLLDNGAEVSFVRLNKGVTATFDIGIPKGITPGSASDTLDARFVPAAIRNEYGNDVDGNQYKFCTQITGIEAKYSGSFGNNLLITIQPVNSTNRAFTYQYANITVYKADFYEQTVKTGNEYVTKAVVRSVTKLENNIVTTNPYDSSYFEDVEFEFIRINATPSARDEFTIIWSNLNGEYTTEDDILSGFPTINLKVTDKDSGRSVYNASALIGSSENPWTTYYTKITSDEAPQNWGTASTFYVKNGDEYTAVTFTGAGTEQDPYVPAYKPNVYYTKDASAEGTKHEPIPTQKGWDFQFTTQMQQVLKTGYSGMIKTVDGKYNEKTVNQYLFECYAPQTITSVTIGTETYSNVGGIVKDIYANLVDCYKNYTDPYIYDFDFITSGSLLDNTFTILYKEGGVDKTLAPTASLEDCTDVFTKFVNGTITTFASVTDTNGDFAINTAGVSTLPVPTRLKDTHIAMIELANTRQDCIALIDPCINWNPEQLTSYVALVNSSYATMHSPYCYVNSPVANELILMPPSYIFLMTELTTLISAGTEVQKWFPPAGVTRATARMVVKPYYEIGSVLLNTWQNDSTSRVNPIMKLKSYGYVIYGNYTCRVADDIESFSALDSLNVRITANCVKKEIFNTCMKLTFEPNNGSLWMKFYDAMDKYLLFMKRNDGVYDYRIQMDESTVTTDDINQLRCPGKVWINPTRTAEFFDIDFTITEAGVTFTNTVGEGE